MFHVKHQVLPSGTSKKKPAIKSKHMQIKIVFKNCVGHVVAVHYFEGLHPLGLPILRATEYGMNVMKEYNLIGYMEVATDGSTFRVKSNG